MLLGRVGDRFCFFVCPAGEKRHDKTKMDRFYRFNSVGIKPNDSRFYTKKNSSYFIVGYVYKLHRILNTSQLEIVLKNTFIKSKSSFSSMKTDSPEGSLDALSSSSGK